VPLPLTNLDDLTWEDLTAEGRSLIPARSQEWTNHNPSDPGITLIELFAYFSESMIYELNRISRDNVLAFLRLINGPGWKPKSSLADEKRNAVQNMRRPHRAVTAQDFEQLTLAVDKRVARVKCIFQRNLESQDPAAQTTEAPGHVSVVIVQARHAQPSMEVLRRAKHALEPARLLTTRIHVVQPRFVILRVCITLVPRHGADPKSLWDEAVRSMELFFDPLQGGLDGKGWPFGRNVYVSEIYRLLDQVPGVDYVIRSKNPKTGEGKDELIVAPSEDARLIWNKQHELEAIELLPDELVSASIDRNEITIAPA
jgi:Baseplate J-like protein